MVAGGSRLNDGFRLDTNGLAANDGTDSTSTPTCDFPRRGVLRAQTNYNGTEVEMRLRANNRDDWLAYIDDCDARITGVGRDIVAATLRLEISAPATVIDSERTDRARRLTIDYPLTIAPPLEFDDF